jgi:hypothetical protein
MSSSFVSFNFDDFMSNDTVSLLGPDSSKEESFRSGLSDPPFLATSIPIASCTPGHELGVRNQVKRVQDHDTSRFGECLLVKDIPGSQPASPEAAESGSIDQGAFSANMDKIGLGKENFIGNYPT